MFDLTKEQIEEINKWMDKCGSGATGAIGGRYTYSFTPTSLGLVVKVEDALTGKKLDVTYYNEW